LSDSPSKPRSGSTGPTAWLAPLYPYLLAGVFRVFGTYTHAAGLAILTLNSLFAALTCLPILLISERLLGRKAALWAAWLWAALPLFFWFAVAWAWETSLSTLLLMTVLWLTLRLERDWRSWFAWGLLWGAIALTNPSLLAIMPWALAWAWVNPHLPKVGRCGAPPIPWQHAALAVAVMALTMLPWMARNRRVFGQWMFVRGVSKERRTSDGRWKAVLSRTSGSCPALRNAPRIWTST
jgi:4-amino-4-deoxy-L-arabinose transferase-like glycosyltransferase